VSSINDTGLAGVQNIGAITQTTVNGSASPVQNTGTITLTGPLSGNGASASISAVGAASSASFRSVR
jgi:hypothetical protein